MYGANGDRRKFQDASKNYGRRQSDYEQNYNKLRQQRDDAANNHNNNNYHQSNEGYKNDSYFGAQNNPNYNNYSQYGENVYTDYNNGGNNGTGYDMNQSQYDATGYNNTMYGYSQYGKDGASYSEASYSYSETNYDNSYMQESSYSQNNDYSQNNNYVSNNDYNQNSNYGADNNSSYTDNNNYMQSGEYSQYKEYYTPEESYGTGYREKTSYEINNEQSVYKTSYGKTGYDKTGYGNSFSKYGEDLEKIMSDNMNSNNANNTENVQCDISVLQPAKSHPVMSIVFRVFIVAFMGIALGEAFRTIFSDFWNEHLHSENPLVSIIRILGIVLVMFVSYILHIIIHEFGHLVGGTLSGYTLISFRIFNFILVRENKKMKLKKYSVTETAGECVMMPPEIKKGKYPYKLFRISGIAMNLITSIIAIVLVVAVGPLGKYPWNMWCVIYAAVGIITCIYNGVPVIIEGIPNEGYILLHMIESKEARLAVHSQLLIYAFLSKGGSYSDVPYEQFCFNSTGELKNFLMIKVKMLEYKWHLEHLDFTQAAKCLEATNQFFNSLPRTLQYEINSEKMFIEILCEHDEDIISKLYNADVRKHIEDSQDVLSKNRILMAYNAGVKGDMREANKNYMQLKKIAKSAPIKGETELQLMLGEYVYDKFCTKK